MGDAFNPWIHIIAATIWVGPQVFLFAAAVPAVRTIEDIQVRARLMRVLTTRFGYLAWGAMLVLVITGVGNLFEHNLEVDVLFDLNYGPILQVKIALVVATVAITSAIFTSRILP